MQSSTGEGDTLQFENSCFFLQLSGYAVKSFAYLRPPLQIFETVHMYWTIAQNISLDEDCARFDDPDNGYNKRELIGIRFVLGTAPSHASIPPNQNGTIAKGR